MWLSRARRRGTGIVTAPLPRVPTEALAEPETLERRFLPGVFLVALVGLLMIQLVLAL
jgi:hypothetical protein